MPKNPPNFLDNDIPPAIKAFIPDPKTRSKINNYLKALNLPELGFYVYELLLIYVKALEAEINIDMKKALEAEIDIKRLRLVGEEVETSGDITGQIRSLIYVQEERIRGILKSINKTLKEYGEKPISAFCQKGDWVELDKFFLEDVIEDVVCPFCGKINEKFTYNSRCSKCDNTIWSPWKEHTVCPHCKHIISYSHIIEDKFAYDFINYYITCQTCKKRFNMKDHRQTPITRGIKVCIDPTCNGRYIPNKYNYKTQQLCPNCKAKCPFGNLA